MADKAADDRAAEKPLTPERWRLVRDVLDHALKLSDPEREEYLVQATAGDPDLYREVTELLALDMQEELLPSRFSLTGSSFPLDGPPPDSLGAYRILGEAGHGGMGVVYRAERVDGQFSKEVAIKLLPALYASTELEARFLRERQILARLEHPNVARLLDGGVAPDGRPYLVMEYVDGVPITAWVQEKGLDVATRLRLFLELCEAVAYAHRNFIVHRDLKPANILVDSQGHVKLLDFGLARLIDAAPHSADITQTVLAMMTPAYASPEQIRGEPIAAASDVFSLGVVLYELLAGRRPFGASGQTIGEVQRAVCEVDPPPPRIDSDLDKVVLKAISKEAGRRYPSVDALAGDLRAYLEGRPVSARPASFGYRGSKFVRRNRIATFLVTAALVGTMAGVVAALRAAHTAELERANAQRRFADVRKIANSFLFEFHDAIAPLKGATPARALVIQRAKEYLAGLAQETRKDPELLRELARSYVMLGDIQGEMSFANLGDTKGSIESYRQAESLHRTLMAATPPSAQNRRGLMVIQQRLAFAYLKIGRPKDALQLLEVAGTTAEELARARPDSEQAVGDMFVQYERLAAVYDKLGDVPKTLESARKAVEMATRQRKINPSHVRVMVLADTHLGQALGAANAEEASRYFREAHELAAERAAARPNDGQAQTDLGLTEVMQSDFLAKAGKPAEALPMVKNGLAILTRMREADPENLEAAKNVADSWSTVGEVYTGLGSHSAAARAYQEAARLLEGAAAKDLLDREMGVSLAQALFQTGREREKLHGCPEAFAWYRKSRDQWTALFQQQAPSSDTDLKSAADATKASSRCEQ